jgi:hypothetical protein
MSVAIDFKEMWVVANELASKDDEEAISESKDDRRMSYLKMMLTMIPQDVN